MGDRDGVVEENKVKRTKGKKKGTNFLVPFRKFYIFNVFYIPFIS